MKILILTNEYPNENYPKPDSPWVVPYFARAWVRQGHEVYVIVNSTKFPRVFYTLGHIFLASYFTKKYSVNAKNVSSNIWANVLSFDDQGVHVKNLPILKFYPGGRFPMAFLNCQIRKIKECLQAENFTPDVITGHWLNPQLLLISKLKNVYHCKTAFVFHSDYDLERIKKFKTARYVGNIDHLGCRSLPAAITLKQNLNLQLQPFVCPSGVPDEYVEMALKKGEHMFSQESLRIMTAGRLVPVKMYDRLIEAAGKLTIPFSVKIVGQGPSEKELANQIEALGLQSSVSLPGRMGRDQLQDEMRHSDVFVLIGLEVFGLVYIEAMMQGCIVVGMKGGGIDGIIIDKDNGFLCEQGDTTQLVDILNYIYSLSSEDKKRISNNAINTAKNYSDSLVAERYLNIITK